MKQKLIFFLMSFLLAASVNAADYDFTCYNSDNVRIFYQYYADGCKVVKSTPTYYSGTLNIPAKATNSSTGIEYDVIAIDDSAFSSCSNLTSVTIPESVIEIGADAFKGSGIYNNENNWSGNYLYIRDWLVATKTGIVSGAIKNGTKRLANNVFWFQSDLTSISIPSTLVEISTSAFYSCTSLETVTIPNTIKRIGMYAFDGCTNLTSVTFANNSTIEEISDCAFYDCTKLSTFSIPTSVKYVGQAILRNTSIYNGTSGWTNNVLYRDKWAVDAKKTVSGVITLASTTKGLCNSLFINCTSLTSVSIPSSVTYFCPSVFNRCTALTKVTINCSPTEIPDQTFSGCKALTTVNIPTTVTKIGFAAFNNCSSLTSITLPSNLTTIGGSAFYGCAKITGLTIPSKVTEIGYEAFSGCKALTTITLPNSVEVVGHDLFSYCTGLTSITLSNKLETIPSGMLYNCTSLTSVTVPQSVKSIEQSAFFGCSNLNTVSLPDNLTSIGASILGISGYYNKSENWDGDLLYYGKYLLNGKNTTECNVKEGTTIIADNVLAGETDLKSVFIPASVKVIGSNAFAKISGLESLTVDNPDPTSIFSPDALVNILYYCRSKVTLYVPQQSIDLYKSTAPWAAFKNFASITYHRDFADAQVYNESTGLLNCDINYTRSFAYDIWQPLYIPFNMSYDEWSNKAKVAEFNGIHEYDTDEDGVIDRLTIEYRTITSGDIVPNVPYVIKPLEIGDVTFECKGKNIVSCNEAPGYIDCCTTRHTYTLYGNYNYINGSTLVGKDAYVIGENGFGKAASNSSLSPQRFYLVITQRTGGYWGNGSSIQRLPKRIELMVDGETSGIVDVIYESQESGIYYDLNGRRVENPSNGFYILDGKKIFIH